MIGNIQDWLIVIGVGILLFGGAKKLPELFKQFGRASGEFKKGQKEIEKELSAMSNEVTTPVKEITQEK